MGYAPGIGLRLTSLVSEGPKLSFEGVYIKFGSRSLTSTLCEFISILPGTFGSLNNAANVNRPYYNDMSFAFHLLWTWVRDGKERSTVDIEIRAKHRGVSSA